MVYYFDIVKTKIPMKVITNEGNTTVLEIDSSFFSQVTKSHILNSYGNDMLEKEKCQEAICTNTFTQYPEPEVSIDVIYFKFPINSITELLKKHNIKIIDENKYIQFSVHIYKSKDNNKDISSKLKQFALIACEKLLNDLQNQTYNDDLKEVLERQEPHKLRYIQTKDTYISYYPLHFFCQDNFVFNVTFSDTLLGIISTIDSKSYFDLVTHDILLITRFYYYLDNRKCFNFLFDETIKYKSLYLSIKTDESKNIEGLIIPIEFHDFYRKRTTKKDKKLLGKLGEYTINKEKLIELFCHLNLANTKLDCYISISFESYDLKQYSQQTCFKEECPKTNQQTCFKEECPKTYSLIKLY